MIIPHTYAAIQIVASYYNIGLVLSWINKPSAGSPVGGPTKVTLSNDGINSILMANSGVNAAILANDGINSAEVASIGS